MSIDRDYFYKALDVTQHAEFERELQRIVWEREDREAFYRKLIERDPQHVQHDTFRSYFEEYSAERRSNQQDFTPESVSELLATLSRVEIGDSDFSAVDPTAGTGGLLIKKWYEDMLQETPWTYAPHRYFYLAQELSDSAIPYLLHNLAMRGMNAVVLHGDTLERKYKQAYFIQNSNDDFLGFSDINVLPHTEDIADFLEVAEWLEDPIDHIESQEVQWRKTAPSMKKTFEVDDSPKAHSPRFVKNQLRLRDVATIERAKKNKVYKKGNVVVQVSATRGQIGLLESDGTVESQHAVIDTGSPITNEFLFRLMERDFERHRHRVQQGLNLIPEHVGEFPISLPT